MLLRGLEVRHIGVYRQEVEMCIFLFKTNMTDLNGKFSNAPTLDVTIVFFFAVPSYLRIFHNL